MLVLGACESGMAQRTGRDERTGFVRAGLRAGTASVVAARWVAKDAVAAAVLDGFDRYTRYLPRDIALQRAQLDVCHGITPTSAPVSAVDHPARWACWTLYGDSGFQTRAGRIRRSLRRSMDGWRRHAARR
jgi:CHAT domain-containing protein